MCINCGDWIDSCELCPGPNGKHKSFYVGEEYCEHKKKEYGHDTARWTDRYGDYWDD